MPLGRPFPNVSAPRLHTCSRIFSIEAKGLEDNSASSSNSKTPGTWEVEVFVPKTFVTGHCGVSGTCLQEALGAKLPLKHMYQGPNMFSTEPHSPCLKQGSVGGVKNG